MSRALVVAAALLMALATAALSEKAEPVHKFHLDDLEIALSAPGAGRVDVKTVDRRAVVTTGRRSEAFIGLVSDALGRDAPAHTADGRPLAVHLTRSLVASLSASGFDARAAALTGNAEARNPAPRTLLLEIGLLRSQSQRRKVWFYYDLTVRVINEEGKELTKNSLSAGTMIGRAKNPDEVEALVRTAVADKLAKLLDHPYVTESLRQP